MSALAAADDARPSWPVELFAPIRALDARVLGGPTVEVRVASGTLLVREGQAVGTFSVIRSGQAELWRAGRRIGTLGPGDCFGEIDPATSAPQPCSVLAGPGLRVLTFSSVGIAALCASMPGLAERLRHALPLPS